MRVSERNLSEEIKDLIKKFEEEYEPWTINHSEAVLALYKAKRIITHLEKIRGNK